LNCLHDGKTKSSDSLGCVWLYNVLIRTQEDGRWKVITISVIPLLTEVCLDCICIMLMSVSKEFQNGVSNEFMTQKDAILVTLDMTL